MWKKNVMQIGERLRQMIHGQRAGTAAHVRDAQPEGIG